MDVYFNLHRSCFAALGTFKVDYYTIDDFAVLSSTAFRAVHERINAGSMLWALVDADGWHADKTTSVAVGEAVYSVSLCIIRIVSRLVSQDHGLQIPLQARRSKAAQRMNSCQAYLSDHDD